MGFRNGAFARVWSCNNNGKSSLCSVSISKKNKETNSYVTDFQDGFVRFVGQAHNDINSLGLVDAESRKKMIAEKQTPKSVTVRLKECDVTNYYTDKDGKSSYNPHYVVFNIELPDASGNFQRNTNGTERGFENNYKPKNDDFVNVPEDADEELPFV